MTVTWGANTTHTYGGGDAPSTSTPGATAPPPTGFSFGSTTTNTAAAAPNNPAPPPTPGFSFGGLTAASPATPAPGGGGLFGGGSSFGATSGGTTTAGSTTSTPFSFGGLLGGGGGGQGGGGFGFGSGAPTTGGLFGSPQLQQSSFGGWGSLGSSFAQPQQSQPQPPQQPTTLMPAQAALQAHLQAVARQEESRVATALSELHKAYGGTAIAPTPTQSAPFAAILYTDLTPELRQQQWLQGLIVAQPSLSLSTDPTSARGATLVPRPIVPPRPAQVSEHDWNAAAAQNPDFATCMPTAVVGAAALQARLAHQQHVANELSRQYQSLQDAVQACDTSRFRPHIDAARDKHAQQKHRLLRLIRQVELIRCAHQPFQKGEREMADHLRELHATIEHRLRPMVGQLCDAARNRQDYRTTGPPQPRRTIASSSVATTTDPDVLDRAIRDQREALERLNTVLQKQVRDVKLLRERLVASTSADPVPVAPVMTAGGGWRR